MMNARRSIFLFGAGLLAVAPALPGAAGPELAPRPNVLLILADDLGFSDIGLYGGEIRTPNLDRLAGEGLRFTQFYNCAVCVNTRGALLTGLHPRPARLTPAMVTLGEVMREAGYATGLIGKWHASTAPAHWPGARGFGEFYGFIGGEVNYFRPSRREWEGPDIVPFMHNDKRHTLADFPKDYYTTDAFSDRAIAFIRQAAREHRPFFLNLCYNAPHSPLHAREEDIARYRGKFRDGYKALRERRHERQRALALFGPQGTALSDAHAKVTDFKFDLDVPDWDRLDDASRKREEERMEVYAAQVDRLDQGIGRVLRALDESGQASRTLVIFLSDNGGSSEPTDFRTPTSGNGPPVGGGPVNEKVGPGWGWAQNAPFRRYKVWSYEGGICTPMIVRWPGVVARGGITAEPGHVVDFMPTLLELSGGHYPRSRQGHDVPPMEGRSLIPILHGKRPEPHRTPLAWELWGGRAIRDGDWKLVLGTGLEQWELYNLATDRTESIDLARQEPDRVARMAAAWKAWANSVSPSGFPPGPRAATTVDIRSEGVARE